ncbi:MAG: hypothetical protein Q6373_006205 [Candidatus Sigynarchaeota archaeon]
MHIDLFKEIEDQAIDALVPEVILVELFKQLYILGGKEYASETINAIYLDGNMPVVALDRLLETCLSSR